jgi:AraC-like DNA-binding protein
MADDPHEATRTDVARSASATIPPNIMRYLQLVLARRGHDLRPALSAVGIEQHALDAPDLRTSYRQGSAVIQQGIRATGDTGLGLEVGAAQHVTSWGLVGLALLSSPTLGDALSLGVRHQNMTGAMLVWSLDRQGDEMSLRLDLPDPGLDPDVGVFLVDEGLASVVALVREGLGPEFTPRSVHLAFPRPAHADRYEEHFGCAVRFDRPSSSVTFPAHWSARPMPGHDPWTLASVLQLVEEGATPRREQQDLLESIEVAVSQGLPHVPSFDDCARRHNLSARTLRRRLAACGTTYEAIVDSVRRSRVEQVLAHSSLTFRDVARQVGFADERTLRRAVARWHGITPSELRTATLERAGTT